MIKSKIMQTIILIIVFMIFSCIDLNTNLPPFIITTPVCSVSNSSNNLIYADISFAFFNKSGKNIESITVSFMLFDFKTEKNPFIGSNLFELTKIITILPNESKDIILSLDKFITIVPLEPYLIDFFYVLKIKYTDGSIWQDRFGLYVI